MFVIINLLLALCFSSSNVNSLPSPNAVPSGLLRKYGSGYIVPGEQCDRTCKKNSAPKLCYFSLTIEDYSVLGGACEFCTPANGYSKAVSNCTCVLGDGVERTIMSVNRQLPSPLLQGCVGDTFIVDVRNKYQGGATTIHWHGIKQKGTPWSDGSPFVTQCPITYGNKYRYFFDLTHSGTFYYHGDTGLDKYNGLSGGLIVRADKSIAPHNDLYDTDKNVVFLQDWLHVNAKDRFPGTRFNNSGSAPDSLLVNGRGIYVNPNGVRSNGTYAHFYIKTGERAMFRLINAHSSSCTALFSIQGHNLTVVGKDGHPIKPIVVNTVSTMGGERVVFIVNGSMSAGDYWIQIRGADSCPSTLIQHAILHYNTNSSVALPKTPKPTATHPYPIGTVFNWLTYCNGTYVCITQATSVERNYPTGLLQKNVQRVYVPFQMYAYNARQFYQSNIEQSFISVSTSGTPTVASMRNISFTLPSSPLLTQFNDIPCKEICSSCNSKDGTPCMCTSIIKLQPCRTYELIFIDNVYNAAPFHHPMHLHGHSFAVIAEGYNSELNIGTTNFSMKAFSDADRAGLIKRNLNPRSPPPLMDTVITRQYGYVIVRVYTDNIGFWSLVCTFANHDIVGMKTVFQVGEVSDMPQAPPGTPRCGNFKPVDLTGYQEIEYCRYADSDDFYYPY